MAFFEQIGKRITGVGQGVVKQERNLTDTARLDAKISENKQKMSQLLFEMGNDYFKKHRKDQNCEEQEYINQVNELFLEILKYQEEIEQIKVAETCKECGARIADGAIFCMNCGVKISGGSKKENAALARTCHVGGAAVDGTGIFCSACGTRLVAKQGKNEEADSEHYQNTELEVSSRVCPQCGKIAEDDDSYCMNCGAILTN